MTTRQQATTLLRTRDADRAREALHVLSGERIDVIDGELREALAGSVAATRAYVREYRELTTVLLNAAHSAQPDLVVETKDGVFAVEIKGYRSRTPIQVMEDAATSAPFTKWAQQYDLGDGVALHLLDSVRELLGARSLQPSPGMSVGELIEHVVVDEITVQRFMRRVRHYLNNPDDKDPVERLMEAYDLSKRELGDLFGVSRQAIDGWLDKGVPADRLEKLSTLLALTELLERKLQAGRLPGIARRPAEAYDGHTMLELVAENRHEELFGKVRDSFDWASAV